MTINLSQQLTDNLPSSMQSDDSQEHSSNQGRKKSTKKRAKLAETSQEVGVVELLKIDMTPQTIVQELDRYIIGQNEAKRAIAIALRNRRRRMLLDPELREEVTPKTFNDRTFWSR